MRTTRRRRMWRMRRMEEEDEVEVARRMRNWVT